MGRAGGRVLVVVTAIVLMVAGVAGPAAAHVTIDTFGEPEQGGFAKLGLSVPNERPDAGTIKLEVQLPEDHPFISVSVQPKAGWESAITMRKLDEPVEGFGGTMVEEVVGTITWTAAAGVRIEPGEFEHFWISVGRLPEIDSVMFPAVQTYDSGEVVSWIEPRTPGGEEPERPAPVVQLVSAQAVDGAATPTVETDDSSEDDDGSTTLAVIALIVGGVGLIAGVSSLVLARRRSA